MKLRHSGNSCRLCVHFVLGHVQQFHCYFVQTAAKITRQDGFRFICDMSETSTNSLQHIVNSTINQTRFDDIIERAIQWA